MRAQQHEPIAHAAPRRPSLTLVVLAVVTLLLAWTVVALRAESLPAKVSRTETVDPRGPVTELSIDAISGEVNVTAGAAFSATAEIVVFAVDRPTAEAMLAETRIERSDGGGALALTTREPGMQVSPDGRGRGFHSKGKRDSGRFRVETRWTVVLPAEAALSVDLVNGNVVSRGVAGDLELASVNGRVEAIGGRGRVELQSVNGAVVASFPELPPTVRLEAETVNGNVTASLPPGASFDFSGRTMNGDIVSTFPLPPRTGGSPDVNDEVRRIRRELERERERAERERSKALEEARKAREEAQRALEQEQQPGESAEMDLHEMEASAAELERQMEQLGEEMARMADQLAREISENLDRSYEGSIGSGGARLELETLNGRVALLGNDSSISAATPLVPRMAGRSGATKRPHAAAAPAAPGAPAPVPVPVAPRSPAPAAAPGAPVAPHVQGPIVRGDIDGDFAVDLPIGDITVGRVSGVVKATTRSGDVRIAGAGKGGEISSFGGDLSIQSAGGPLEATTFGGDIHVGTMRASARLETMGGDVVVGQADGPLDVRTGGGDIAVRKASARVDAETSGGSISCTVVAKEGGPIRLVTRGGDVEVVLPADWSGEVDARVTGADPEVATIRCDFAGVDVAVGTSTQRATGRIGSGGSSLEIRSASGEVVIRKAGRR